MLRCKPALNLLCFLFPRPTPWARQPNNGTRLTVPQPASVRKPSADPRVDSAILGSTAAAVALRPPLKWAGGKRWQVPHLRPLWDRHRARRLVEPFCGGLAVTLSLMPSRALLNDVNPHVVNFFRWLKRGLKADIAMLNDAATYYANRTRFNALLANGQADAAEAAALFYYLNRTGYNGLCRFNQQGEFNVPFGRYKRIGYQTDFSDYIAAFARFEFTNIDFEAIPLESDDFVYADPPYDVEFRQYSKDGFGWHEQVRTAEWLAKHPGPVVLSNQATDRITKLYRRLGYTLTPLTAPRLISCTGDRTPAEEVLATRNL
jgi:DNA adenine methylase